MFEELFAPGRKHTDDERKRLELSRVDLNDGDPGRGPIDLTSGKVVVRARPPAPDPPEETPAAGPAPRDPATEPATPPGADRTEPEPSGADRRAPAEPEPPGAG
ncbi:DUF6191 domain-containing protein [Streptomyces sp. NPDC054842]